MECGVWRVKSGVWSVESVVCCRVVVAMKFLLHTKYYGKGTRVEEGVEEEEKEGEKCRGKLHRDTTTSSYIHTYKSIISIYNEEEIKK